MNRVSSRSWLLVAVALVSALGGRSGAGAARGTRARRGGGVVHRRQGEAGARRVPGSGPAASTSRARARRRTVNFHSAPPPADLKKRDQQTKPNKPTVDEARPARRAQEPPPARASARCSSPRSRASRTSSSSTPKNSPDRAAARAAPRGGLRRARERRVPREDAGRDQARRRSRRRTRGAPGSSRRGRQPGRTTVMKAARDDTRVEDYYGTHHERLPELPAARRGPLLPRLRVRAGERQRQRAHGLLRAHQEARRTRSTSRTRTSPSASSSSTRRRAIRASGTRRAGVHRRSSSTRRPTTRSTATPGTSSRTSSGTRATSPRRSTRSRRRSTTASRTRSCPNAAKLADSARRDIIPVYALEGRPGAAYNFFHNISGDHVGLERQDVQDDGRPRPELPGHRSLSRGHRALQGPDGPRQRRRQVLRLPGAHHRSDAWR